MKIYIDVVFLLNLIFDGIILVLTSYMTKSNLPFKRLLLSAVIAASMVIYSITPWSKYTSTVLFKIIYSILIIYAGFRPKSLQKALTLLAAFYFVTFSLGGMILGLHFFLMDNVTIANGTMITTNSGYGDPTTWGFVLLFFPIGAYFYKKNIEYIKIVKLHQESIYDVKICFPNFELNCTGLLDTGNYLSDPFTGTPVIVLDVSTCIHDLPDSIVEMAFRWKNVMDTNCFSGDWEQLDARIIPFSSLGNSNGMMLTVAPLEIEMKNNNQIYRIEKIRVGLSTQRLSSEGNFSCILNPKMLEIAKEAV